MDNIYFDEYSNMVPGCLRRVEPKCPYAAVIPSVVVDDKKNLKKLAACFVHVTNINTTFYIDDKHRMMITWAGPVEVDNYDFSNNPLGLRSQIVYDFANGTAAYYNANGEYRFIDLANPTPTPVPES